MSNSRTFNSIRNIFFGFGGQLIQILLTFVSRAVFVSFLSTEYLGVNGLFTNILSLLSLAELGVGSAIVYTLYKPLADKNEKKIKVLMDFYCKSYKIIGLIVLTFGLVLMPFLEIFIKEVPEIPENIYIIFIFYLFNTVITYFYSYKSALISADQKNYIVTIRTQIINIIQTVLQIIILALTRNFLCYLLVQSMCIFAYNLLISRTADRLYPYLKNKVNDKLNDIEKKDMIENIKALMIVKVSGVLVNNTDNLIISYLCGLTKLGLVSNYTLIINALNSIVGQIFTAITASVGNLNASSSNNNRYKFFKILNFLNFWIFGFVTIGFIIMSKDIVRIWLGENYVIGTGVVIALAINFYMLGMQNAIIVYKNTLGLFVYGRYLLLITAAINLFLSFYLGNKFGLFGIFISTAIARLMTNVWYHPYIVFKHGLNKKVMPYFVRYIWYAIILVIALLTTDYLCSLIKYDLFTTIVLKFIICMVMPNLIFTIVFFRTQEFNYLINLALRPVKNLSIKRKQLI